MCGVTFFGASLGYLGLALVCFVPALAPLSPKLSMRLSVLMPLQGLILLGLSFRQDPVAWLFSLDLGGYPLPGFGSIRYRYL